MRTAIVLALALATGCGDDDGDPSNYVPVTEIGKAYKEAYCTYAVRCGYFPDATSCTGAALLTTAMTFTLDANEVAAVQAGRVYYNGSNLKACFAALAAQSCDKTDMDGRLLGSMVACRDILRGTITAGNTCTIDAECISGVCSSGGTTCSTGVCIGSTPPSYEPGQLGQQCSPYCAEGLYCDLTANTCAVLKGAGSVCQQATECAYGLTCITDTATTTRTCKAAPTLDQLCPDFMCRDDGLYCNTTTMTCKQIGLPPAMCTSSTQCSTYYPCDFTLTQCKKGPTLGMPCSTTNRCFDAGTYCDTALAMCVAAKPDGTPCNLDSECANGNCDTTQVTPVCAGPMTCF